MSWGLLPRAVLALEGDGPVESAQAQRHHDPAVLGELVHPGGGEIGSLDGDHDPVVRRVLRLPSAPSTTSACPRPYTAAGRSRGHTRPISSYAFTDGSPPGAVGPRADVLTRKVRPSLD
ncbi:hypothetical protein AA958_17460 [Streptomyces sp. CNQ-509]|nr:hypothetical protein AA958_17460 [Streptomyces sp. CNQ-509]